MKNFVIAGMLALAITAPAVMTAQNNAPNPTIVNLKEGSVIQVVLTQDVNSKSARQGDVVKVTAKNDVYEGTNLVIRAGASGTGHVETAQGAGAFHKKGALEINVDYIQSVDPGKNVKISGKIAEGSTGQHLSPSMAFGLAGSGKGKEITIPSGTEVNAYIGAAQQVTIDTK